MQFIYPNLLYALFLLGIPIIIHLFRLRKYQPVAFTNVSMLQKIEKQSRKSYTILQWILLFLRLMIYSCIIFAFAQPFFPKPSKDISTEEVLIYIDNSLSMDAKINNIPLLSHIKNELTKIDKIPPSITWFSNTEVFYDQTPKTFLESVQNLNLSPIVRSVNEIELLTQQLVARYPEKKYKLIWISDFHRIREREIAKLQKIDIETFSIQPDNLQNTSIDTLYMDYSSSDLIVEIFHKGKESETTLSLYNNEESIGRQKIQLQDSTITKATFKLLENNIPQGKVKIQDQSIQYDNEKFFSLLPQEPIQVKVIGSGESPYLKVFESSEFQLEKLQSNTIDLSSLEHSNLIILYNLDRLTPQLSNILEAYINQGTFLLIIPSSNLHLDSYNDFLQKVDAPQFTLKKTHDRRISTIHYDHPNLFNVFERRVENFQPPFVHEYYGLQYKGSPILSYDSDEAFLTQNGKVFLFTAPLLRSNTNFIESPLIVPSLHTIALQSQPQKQLYQMLGTTTTYAITGEFDTQDILYITDSENSFIPLQEQRQHSIWVTTSDRPEKPENYRITRNDETIDWVSYNYPNLDKNIQFPNLDNWKSITPLKKLELTEDSQSLNVDSHTLWKWFVIFALILLGVEILLLRFYR